MFAGGSRIRAVAPSGFFWLLVLGWTAPAGAQLPTVPPDDYERFERLGAFELDPLGVWVVAAITRGDGERELRLHRSDGSGDPLVLAHGSGPEFSGDGRWMAYRKGVPEDERETSETPIEDRLGLVDLDAGTDTVLFDVRGFAFRDDGAWLAAAGAPAADSVGADLLVLDPASGARTLIGNVDDFAWQDDGPLLAVTLRTAGDVGNGVVVFDPEASTLRTLDSGDDDYAGPTWHGASSQLAVLRSVDADDRKEPSHDLLVWDDVRTTPARVMEAVGGGVPADMRVTPDAGVRFGDDGRSIFFGIRPWEPADTVEADETGADGGAREPAPDAERPDTAARADRAGSESEDGDVEPADVQIWHWDDDLILRAQEYRADQIARRSLLTVWHMDADRVAVLGDDLDEPVTLAGDGRWGLVADHDPYLFERRFGAGTADWYRVDTRTGDRDLLARGLEFGVESSEEGSRVLMYAADRWTAVDLATLEPTALDPGVDFTRPLREYDYPGPRPHWGLGAWTPDGAAALLYDEHDVYRADLTTGSVERLTRGAAEGLRYRVVDPDPGSSFGPVELEPEQDVWLSVFDRRSKASGYARLADGAAGPRTLVFEDARVAGLTAAADADRLAWRVERWDDAPDVFVGNGDLEGATRVMRTNPFQDEYAWGRAELLDYTTDAGHDLQAILVYPADFEEGRRYPLILYQYERLSDNLHRYEVPSERDYYDFQAWSQEGYFVLMPDIVYEPGRPGPSALDAVEHALDAAVATGHVDPEGMGLIGHSWGGYQATYLPTRTHRFAASVAGAPITNFLSFMGAVHWNGGLPETGHWETGQARMAVPYWEDLEGHLESSPANFIADLDTPLLLMHGDADGVVDFGQGLEFYNYARRAGKEAVLLVYPGADHGLTKETHQVDYHRRILEWFGHYLKGDPASRWITEGETWVERAERMGGEDR
jgi:dipeptidyl aminopeptidase/acylaminoacyl peptidase